MKKLSLNLDSLAVESFDTSPLARLGSRTVHAHSGEVPIGGATDQLTCGCTNYEDATCQTGCTDGAECHLTEVSCPDPYATVGATCRFCVSGGPIGSCSAGC
jgi:hypothetical protein